MPGGLLSALPGGAGFTSGSVYPIYEDREGSLWVGTADGGLHQLRDSKFITFTEQDGLADNDARRMLLDGDYIWVATRGGICQFYWNSPDRLD